MYILKCFPIRGKTEQIRLLLEDNQIKYTEVNVDGEWTIKQKELSIQFYPFAHLPMLSEQSMSEKKDPICNADPIMRHLGRVYNLYGINENEKALIDVLFAACNGIEKFLIADWREAYSRVVYSPNFDMLKGQYKAVVDEYVKYFNNVASKGRFIAGKHISFVDYSLFDILTLHQKMFPDFLENRQALQVYVQRMNDRVLIKTYIASSKRQERINGIGAYYN